MKKKGEQEFLEYTDDIEEKFALYRAENLCDIYNANQFKELHGNNVRYCFKRNRWLIWNNKKWKFDEAEKILLYAENTQKSLEWNAKTFEDPNEQKRRLDHAKKLGSRQKLCDMIFIVRSHLPILPEDLDKDDFLFNIENGILDLHTGILGNHDREKFITKISPVTYKLSEECPRWIQFLKEIMDGNERKIEYLQRAIGYSLTGSTRERVFFILYGTGANGKSTFLNTLTELFGEYATTIPTSTLFSKTSDSIPNDIAKLRGSRFVTAYEGEEEKRLDEGLIKRMTGQDIMTARHLWEEYFDFFPKFKLWFATNHKPIIWGNDKAIWDRIRLIPFTVTIPEERQDKDLIDKLKCELTGILNWCVDGALKWQKEGLGFPTEIKKATNDYRYEMDSLGSFLQDYCILADDNTISTLDNKITLFNLTEKRIPYVKSSKLYDKWVYVTGNKHISQTLFSRKMIERGYVRKRFPDAQYWIGIGLLEDDI